MRRKDRERSRDEALAFLDKCEYAVLATVNEDGSPYCIPLSVVRDNDLVYFHCAAEGQKVENMRKCSEVCLTCVGNTRVQEKMFTTEYESAVVFGRAEQILADEEKKYALGLLCKKYTPNNMDAFDVAVEKSLHHTGVWKIKIDRITGKGNKSAG